MISFKSSDRQAPGLESSNHAPRANSQYVYIVVGFGGWDILVLLEECRVRGGLKLLCLSCPPILLCFFIALASSATSGFDVMMMLDH